MTRRWVIALIIAAAALGAGYLLWMRFVPSLPSNRIALAGDVQSDVHTVQAPAISYPVPDYSVGIPTSQTASSGAKRGGGAPAASLQPTISGEIARMYVQQGDHVDAGQVIVQYDTARLELGVQQAKTAAQRARAQVAVLGKALDTIATNQDKLATARGQLATGKSALAKAAAQLAKAQASFPAQKAAALKQRAELVATLAMLQQQLAQLLQSPNPNPQAVAALKANIAKLTVGINAIDKGLAAAATGFATGNAQLAKGKAQLATASSQLAQGSSALSKAKKQVENARKVSNLLLASTDAAVTIAEVRLSQATVHAPVSGIVTEARSQGTIAMVGAPLVRIRPDEPTKVISYLDPTQLSRVHEGSVATVNYDSNSGRPLSGKVTQIALNSQFPPTSFPTTIVHMTQTVQITVTLENGGWAPPGTPVDLVIDTSGTN